LQEDAEDEEEEAAKGARCNVFVVFDLWQPRQRATCHFDMCMCVCVYNCLCVSFSCQLPKMLRQQQQQQLNPQTVAPSTINPPHCATIYATSLSLGHAPRNETKLLLLLLLLPSPSSSSSSSSCCCCFYFLKLYARFIKI